MKEEGDSIPYKDEELDCEYIGKFNESGSINVCFGNEPYRCHRAKEEGLCHKLKQKGENRPLFYLTIKHNKIKINIELGGEKR